ncbi:anti-sigma F factor antagonist [Clostridium grantii]|uniref:Anti-sigma F factor antagonist n=1 Tax=Clostridium grantii DSM 8605 TaxID=1121316 RepID=A0A1M5SLA0_9CLOT|nr:anti-sigma F factor antagonist [Clostridium grantii]SHH39342.1 anti-anti-sigma regulatory factor, SpoIIAA [Clostridium grantii DSM 8605]
MYIKFTNTKNTLVAHLSGELDHHSASEVRSKLDDMIERTNALNLVMDFSEVSFMDSSGIGVVIGRYKKLLSKKGKVSISNANGSVRRVFELSGMFKIIPVYNNSDEAIKSV